MKAILLVMILYLAAVDAAPRARTRNGNGRASPWPQANGENANRRRGGCSNHQDDANDRSSKHATERTNAQPAMRGSADLLRIDTYTTADKAYQILELVYNAKNKDNTAYLSSFIRHDVQVLLHAQNNSHSGTFSVILMEATKGINYRTDLPTFPPEATETVVSTTLSFLPTAMSTNVDLWAQWLQVWRESQRGCGVPRPDPSIPVPQPRVAGGQTAQRGSWPWMVSLSPKPMNGQHFCGGVLLSTTWVLTCAHCLLVIPSLWDENRWLVRLGKLVQEGPQREQTEQDYDISKIVLHPDFDMSMVRPAYIESHGKPSDHDLALIKLSSEVNVTQWVRPICLPEADFQPEAGKTCVITGWGFTQDPTRNASRAQGIRLPRYLQQGVVPLWDYNDCKKLERYSDLLTPNMLCAGDEDGRVDACKFDSGGPLQCEYNGRWFAIGVTSWGDAGGDGCAQPMKPGVYTNVGAHVTWILQTIYADYAHLPQLTWKDSLKSYFGTAGK